MSVQNAAVIAVSRATAAWKRWVSLSPSERRAERDRFVLEGCLATWRPGYEWCGAFAAWCWSAVHPRLRRSLFASTYRVYLLGSYRSDSNLWPSGLVKADGALLPVREWHGQRPRLHVIGDAVPGARVEPGDVIVTGSGKYGKHIQLAAEESRPGERVRCISGNGSGETALGERGRGVVVDDAPRDRIAQVVRLSPCDLITEGVSYPLK
jgi:hypothetical protein